MLNANSNAYKKTYTSKNSLTIAFGVIGLDQDRTAAQMRKGKSRLKS